MTNNTVNFEAPTQINKVCSCGRVYEQIPETHKAWIDEGQLIGWVWNCSCDSTLFVPSFNLKKQLSEKDFGGLVSEFLHKVYKRVL